MADYTVRFAAQDDMSKTINDIDKSLEGMNEAANKTAESLKKFDSFSDDFKDITTNSKSLKSELRQLQTLIARMNLEDGFDDKGLMLQAAQRAGEIKDAIDDAAQSVRGFASDTAGLDAGLQAFQAGTAAITIYTGAIGLFGKENEAVEQAILKVQSAIAILNGVQQIANVLNKDSALMTQLKATKLKIATAMQNANNVSNATGNTLEATGNNLKKTDIALTTAQAAKTAIATSAQNAWNAAKAIGMAMLGNMTGLLMLGIAGMTAYAIATDDSTDKIKKQTEEEKNAAEAKKNFNSTLASTYAKLMGSYQQLRAEWSKLSSDQERNNWIKNNQAALRELGGEIKTAKDAEDFLNKNTNAVVESFRRKAQAAAYFQAMVSAYEKQLEIENQAEEVLSKRGKNAGDKYEGSFTMDRGSARGNYQEGNGGTIYSNDRGATWYYTAKGAAKYNAELFKTNKQLKELNDAYKANNEAITTYEQKFKELATISKNLPTTGGGGKKDKTTTQKVNEENKRYAQELAAAQAAFNNGAITELDLKQKIANIEKSHLDTLIKLGTATKADADRYKNALQEAAQAQIVADIEKKKLDIQQQYADGMLTEVEYAQALANLQKEIYDQNRKIGTSTKEMADNFLAAKKHAEELSAGIDKGSIADIEKQISEIDKKLVNKKLTLSARLKLEAERDKLQAQLDAIDFGNITIKVPVEPIRSNVKGDLFDLRQSRENAKKAMDQIVSDFEAGIKSADQAKKEIKLLNDELVAMGQKKIEIHIETDFEKFQAGFDGFMSNMNAIDGMVNSFSSLGKAIEENADAWTILMGVLSTVQSVIGAINAVMEIANMLSGLSAGAKTAEAAASTASATATTAEATAEGSAVAPKTAETVANRALEASILDLAAAQIFAAHAAIPFVGVGLATGFIASMMAAMAAQHAASLALMAFKEGGIVGGSAAEHPILAHSGEMILNEKQQRNLFEAIDKNRLGNGNNITGVVGRVRGKDLELVLDNVKRSKKSAGLSLSF